MIVLRQGYKDFDSSLDNFGALLNLLEDEDEVGRVSVLSNAPKDSKIITPSIQKEIIDVCVNETLRKIIEEVVKCGIFAIIGRGANCIFLRYVNPKGHVIERFVGVVHDGFGSSILLMREISSFFGNHGLSISKLRAQGYNGESNMREEFHSLKNLILNENSRAYFEHCCVHQHQLALVNFAKCNYTLWGFFRKVTDTFEFLLYI